MERKFKKYSSSTVWNDCFIALFLISTLIIPLVFFYKLDQNMTKITCPIIYQVDNVGGMMVGKITDKEIIAGRYTVTIGAYGKFLVTKEQFESIKIGDEAPEYLKKRGS